MSEVNEETISSESLSNVVDGTEVPNEEEVNTIRCLLFESGGLQMFLSTEYVIEIITDHSITKVPAVPSYVCGVINLRGSILPVVDIRILMGKDPVQYTNKTCIIVLNINSVNVGIIVDSVHSVVDVNPEEISPLPIHKKQKLANGMIKLEDGSIGMSFDCQSLVRG